VEPHQPRGPGRRVGIRLLELFRTLVHVGVHFRQELQREDSRQGRGRRVGCGAVCTRWATLRCALYIRVLIWGVALISTAHTGAA